MIIEGALVDLVKFIVGSGGTLLLVCFIIYAYDIDNCLIENKDKDSRIYVKKTKNRNITKLHI